MAIKDWFKGQRATSEAVEAAAEQSNFETIEVPVERWGGSVVIREQTVEDHLAALAAYEAEDIEDDLAKNLWMLGRLIVSPEIADDVLMRTPLPIISELLDGMLEVSGLVDDAVKSGAEPDDAGRHSVPDSSGSTGHGGKDSSGDDG